MCTNVKLLVLNIVYLFQQCIWLCIRKKHCFPQTFRSNRLQIPHTVYQNREDHYLWILLMRTVSDICSINPFPPITAFCRICIRRLLKTVWQKEKLLQNYSCGLVPISALLTLSHHERILPHLQQTTFENGAQKLYLNIIL